jgi:hypothetical protein
MLGDQMAEGIKLEINFLKSSEDHRLQLVEVNGSIFAVVHANLESNGPIRLDCEEWSLILLNPIKSKKDINISAFSVICFNEIASEEGGVSIMASNRLVKFASSKSPEKVTEEGKRGEFHFEEDLSAFLYFFRLFNGVVSCARHESQESFLEAQQKFITGLCVLAAKIDRETENLNIHRVLEIWDIPLLEP